MTGRSKPVHGGEDRLHNRAGDGHLVQSLNKQASGHDPRFGFRIGFLTNALMEFIGSDRLRLPFSPDASTFHDTLRADPVSGILVKPRLPRCWHPASPDAQGRLMGDPLSAHRADAP